jgi:hypothetical protein
MSPLVFRNVIPDQASFIVRVELCVDGGMRQI